jgi:release factor glutamine methyltransferase
MYDNFIRSYNIIRESGLSNPLYETLRLFDIMSAGKTGESLSCFNKSMDDIAGIAEERKKGVPMEYILGMVTFNGKSFFCTNSTLIPTEETSLLVATASDFIGKRQQANRDPQTVIEIGTGCGNIAVSLAALVGADVRIMASDISEPAVEIAKKNVSSFNVGDKVTLYCGDLFDPFADYEGKTDMVICNPPYIPTTSLKKLPPEIIDHEPMVALDGGPYGLNFFKRLISEALRMLKQGGILIFEIGQGQEKLINLLFNKNSGYEDIRKFRRDDHIRVISAKKR